MELRLPFKLKIKYLNANANCFEGKAVFHEKEYHIKIYAENNEKNIKVPFPVIGLTDDEILMRMSAPSGVYVQDYVIFKGQSEFVEINSDTIFSEITNSQHKFDTMEIFVK
jgi:effector-binding domain-containing protein